MFKTFINIVLYVWVIVLYNKGEILLQGVVIVELTRKLDQKFSLATSFPILSLHFFTPFFFHALNIMQI